jgi:NADPH-dependent curcumin reductase CurA
VSLLNTPLIQRYQRSIWIPLAYSARLNGLSACAGVFREMKLKPESTLLVSRAAGSVATCVIQLAKHVVGCKRVIGIAGGKEKCDWVKSPGADECVDYKSASFAKDLKAALPDESDFFSNNIGGEVLNNALTVVKQYGCVFVCGAISGEYPKGKVDLGYHGKPLELMIGEKSFTTGLHSKVSKVMNWLIRSYHSRLCSSI